MTVARSVSEVLSKHVQFEIESLDRLYLNLYVPQLQRAEGCAYFFRHHRGQPQPSSALMAPMTRAFVRQIENFAKREGIDLIVFKKNQKKEALAQEYLARFPHREGILFIGKAQEKARVVRTERRHNPETGARYPHLIYSTAMVNQYYIYAVDRNFGPFFLKFSSYFPYTGKACLNGHEYLKRQLDQRQIPYQALDNGLLECEDPNRAQRLANQLDARAIQRFLAKWLRRLPHPFTTEDRQAGYDYQISIVQCECSLTQVLDRPLSGRLFFEQVIRDNLDLGRPDRVQLIFNRRITRRTPGRFRTRIITEGVTPSLHIEYKKTRIKQYHKLGRALRTETTINDSYDFAIGRRLKNLTALREVGFTANQRVLHVQRLSHDASIGEAAFATLQQPTEVQGQRASALRFGDPRILALLAALVLFRLLPQGFANRDLRQHVAQIREQPPEQISRGAMTYDLRRLRLHGLIERIPRTHRYRVTDPGFRVALFFTRSYARLLRPGLAVLLTEQPTAPTPLRQAFQRVETEIHKIWQSQQIAA